ncbi:MAG: hypothetical protein PVF27_10320 [Gemmatimonadales bacterium]|jgi:hypothetical protein
MNIRIPFVWCAVTAVGCMPTDTATHSWQMSLNPASDEALAAARDRLGAFEAELADSGLTVVATAGNVLYEAGASIQEETRVYGGDYLGARNVRLRVTERTARAEGPDLVVQAVVFGEPRPGTEPPLERIRARIEQVMLPRSPE